MRLINADELPWHEVNIGGFVDTIVTPEDIDTMMIYKPETLLAEEVKKPIERRFIMNKDCKYLRIEDITPWHGDVFDHPSYDYYCEKKCQKLLGTFSCSYCDKYEEGED